MTNYDPKIILKYADKLYATANTIVLAYVITGAVVGGAIGHVLGHDRVQFLFFLLMFAGMGVAHGLEKALLLKVQAQTALCQMQIEENTRKPKDL